MIEPNPKRDTATEDASVLTEAPSVQDERLEDVVRTSEKKSLAARLEDAALVRRCLAGEAGAWDDLYESFQSGIASSVISLLGPGTHDPNLIDEIVARVWYSIVADQGKVLAQYDPNQGARLVTFFRLRARYEISLLFRSERRRLKREMVAYNEKPNHGPKDSNEPTVLLRDFMTTLTPRERRFCEDHLLSEVSDSRIAEDSKPSKTTAWRINRQIQEKLSTYLDGGQ